MAAILEKLKKSPYISSGLTDRHEIWHDDTYWPSPPSPALKVTHDTPALPHYRKCVMETGGNGNDLSATAMDVIKFASCLGMTICNDVSTLVGCDHARGRVCKHSLLHTSTNIGRQKSHCAIRRVIKRGFRQTARYAWHIQFDPSLSAATKARVVYSRVLGACQGVDVEKRRIGKWRTRLHSSESKSPCKSDIVAWIVELFVALIQFETLHRTIEYNEKVPLCPVTSRNQIDYALSVGNWNRPMKLNTDFEN